MNKILIYRALAFFIISLLVFSCSEPTKESSKYKDYISTLDSLSNQVIIQKDSVLSFDTLMIGKAVSHYLKSSSIIKRYYTPDSLTFNVYVALNNYKGIKKVGRQLLDQRKSILSEITFSKNQSDKLVEALVHESYPQDTAKLYFDSEKLAMNNLLTSIKKFKKHANFTIDTYNTYGPTIDSMINTIPIESLPEEYR